MHGTRQSAPVKQEKIPRVEVYWTTVTYRTVAVYLVMIFAIVLATLYLIHPDWYSNVLDRMSRTFGAVPGGGALTQNQARFVNLDGKVEVKKANSVNWQIADYNTTLNKGDLIRTGVDGAARITFVDGTTYTIKSNSFVTVEENSMTRDHTTDVAVHISAGAVDLTTGTWSSPRSKAEVSFANARASLAENSRAAVRTDPKADSSQITVSAGAAQMQIGSQHIEIGKWQRVTFAGNGPIVKTNVLAPPDLIEPVNLQPLIEPDPKHTPVHFSWSPVPDAVRYTLKVSSNSMLTRVVTEKTVTGTSADITGLDPGDYFWGVTAIDAHNRDSTPSDPFKFTLVAQGKGQGMLLEVDGTELHGNVVEIIGRTDPAAALIIDGQIVADIQPDGRFRYFTQPLSTGSHEIVITGQNRRGGTAVKRISIVIP